MSDDALFRLSSLSVAHYVLIAGSYDARPPHLCWPPPLPCGCAALHGAHDLAGPCRLERGLHASELNRIRLVLQNTSSYYTQDERILLTQSAIDQYIVHGWGEGGMMLATHTSDCEWSGTSNSDSVLTRLLLRSVRTVESMLQMLSAIARTDAIVSTTHNAWLVDEQLRFLLQNDQK